MTNRTLVDSLHILADAYLFAGYVDEAVTTLARGITIVESEIIEAVDKLTHANLLLHYGALLNKQSFIGQNRFAETIRILTRAQSIAEDLSDSALEAKLLLELGSAYDKRKLITDEGNYQISLEYAQQALVKFEEAQEGVGVGRAHFDVGLGHQRLQNKVEAIDHFNKAVAIAEKYDQKLDLSFALRHRGYFYFLEGDVETAYQYIKKSLQLREEIGCRFLLSPAHHVLGLAYQERGDKENALAHFQTGLDLATMLNLRLFTLQPLFSLAEWYRDIQDDEQAKVYLQQALNTARDINYYRAIEMATNKLAELDNTNI